MAKYVALPILVEPTVGGWITYTAHLAQGLINAGYTPIIMRIGKRTIRGTKSFAGQIQYINTTLEDALHYSKGIPTIVTAVDGKNRHNLQPFLDRGASLVIHDPTEFDASFIAELSGADIITIRRTISDTLAKLGLPNRYTPHPYHRADPVETEKQYGAIALSRIDWDKRTEIIVKANTLLPEDKQILIFGKLNSQYEYHKLTPIDPGWRRNYAGNWSPKEPLFYPVLLARKATQIIDLSIIQGDGGGTQYSFLEAFDAETPLTVHERWLTGNPEYDEIAQACTAIASPEELAEQILNPQIPNPDLVHEILANHEATLIAKLTLP
jgi:hypothetical protein